MDMRGVIVVLLMDQRIAMKAVAEKYKELADTERDENEIARDYIGKIVQLPIMLPVSAPDYVKAYVYDQLFKSVKVNKDAPDSLKSTGAKPRPTAGPTIAPESTIEPTAPTSEGSAREDVGKRPIQAPTPTEPQQGSMPPAESKGQPNAVTGQRFQEIQAEMRDTASDREAFLHCVNLFQMSNPRQLLRLRNSFRVLKGLLAARGGDTDAGASETEIRQSLLLLFWLEFLNDRKREARRAFASSVYSNGEIGNREGQHPLNAGEQRLAQRIKAEMERHFGADCCQQEAFLKLKECARRLVLPFHEDLGGTQPAVIQMIQSSSKQLPSLSLNS